MGVPRRDLLVTTVIPTFRRPKQLRRAIRSVLSQTYPHFRVCVYDNASGDETPSVVDEFARRDGRIKYTRRPENIGACRNFADAAARIDTPFFSFLSDDDVLLPNFYETALAGFEQFPDAMMSATACVHINELGEVSNVPILNWRPGLYLPPRGLLTMVENGHPEWTSVLFRRELLTAIGPPDTELGGPFDLDFELRAAARFPMAVSLQPGALFVIHKDSTGILGGLDSLCPGWYKMTCKIAADDTIPRKARSQAAHLLSRSITRMLLRSSLSLTASGDWLRADQAIGYLANYCRITPRLLKLLVKACRRFEPLRQTMSGGIAFRRFIFGSSAVLARDKELQSQFGAYARCLEL